MEFCAQHIFYTMLSKLFNGIGFMRDTKIDSPDERGEIKKRTKKDFKTFLRFFFSRFVCVCVCFLVYFLSNRKAYKSSIYQLKDEFTVEVN